MFWSDSYSTTVCYLVCMCVQMLEVGVVEVLQPMLTLGPRQRYHATRSLVYLGQLHLLKGCSLFDNSGVEYELDMSVMVTDSDGHTYSRYVRIADQVSRTEILYHHREVCYLYCVTISRGATIEKCAL